MDITTLDYYLSITKRLVEQYGYSSVLSYNQLYTVLYDLNQFLPSNVHFHIPTMIKVMCEYQFVQKVPPKSLYNYIKEANIHQYKLPDSEEELNNIYVSALF